MHCQPGFALTRTPTSGCAGQTVCSALSHTPGLHPLQARGYLPAQVALTEQQVRLSGLSCVCEGSWSAPSVMCVELPLKCPRRPPRRPVGRVPNCHWSFQSCAAAEGVSYLVIVGLVAWSLYTKVETGSGLPAGPSGVLGAAEGFSYLSLVIGIVVAGLQAAS